MAARGVFPKGTDESRPGMKRGAMVVALAVAVILVAVIFFLSAPFNQEPKMTFAVDPDMKRAEKEVAMDVQEALEASKVAQDPLVSALE